MNWRGGNSFPGFLIIQTKQGQENKEWPSRQSSSENICSYLFSRSPYSAIYLLSPPYPSAGGAKRKSSNVPIVNVPVTTSVAFPAATSPTARVPFPYGRLTVHRCDSDFNQDSRTMPATQACSYLPDMEQSKRPRRDFGGVDDYQIYSCLAMPYLNRQKDAILLPSRVLKITVLRPYNTGFIQTTNQPVLPSWEHSPRGTGQFWVFG